MKLRKAVVISILFLLGIASVGAVIALYSEFSVKASVPDYAAGLSSIPSDYKFVFGINVQKFAHSPVYSKFQQNRQVGGDLASFVEKTGLDPMRDIQYVVGAGSGKETSGADKGVVIASGVFNRDAIKSYIRSKAAPVEKTYEGVSVMMIPDSKSDAVQNGIAFLSDQEIAMGNLESLKEVLDLKRQKGRSILDNETMEPLLRSLVLDEMFWFAGDASTLISRAPASSPLAGKLMTNSSSIKSIAGTVNIEEALSAKITATAFSADQALKLADTVRGLIAFGQIAGNQHPELRALIDGVKVSQDLDQVRLELNISADLLAKMSQSSKSRP